MTGRLLVVGTGQAGVQTASAVRALGWTGPVTLVGAEPHAPYQRPQLSKAYLRGDADEAALALRSQDFYEDQSLDLVLGERVARLDLTGAGGGTATASTGRTFGFDRLVLATGAAPRRPPLPGAELGGVLTLRDVGDARTLASRLSTAGGLVVVGGGLIGLEVAATAVAAGVRTTVVEAAPWLMGRVVSTGTAAYIEAAHRAAGVDILLGTAPSRLVDAGDGTVCAVELENGTRLQADLVLMAVGARPRDDLARAAGLACDGGVVVDARALASDGHTVAVGDCTTLPDPSPTAGPARRVRLESVDNAVEQAAVAAATLMGAPPPRRGVPWFWSDQGELKLQIAGLARPDDSVVARPGRRPGQYTVLRYRAERLVAAECVNSPADFLLLRKALASGAHLPAEAAGETALSLREHLAAATGG
ncbi:NAD(P)/FAD-dependent oxidoreductase [Streptomyces albidoflavus]